MSRSFITLGILWFGCAWTAFAGGDRDTVLVAVLNLGYPVNSVFNGEGGVVHLTGAKGLEHRVGAGEFEVLDPFQTTPVFWTGSALVDGNEWSALFGKDPFQAGRVWQDFFGQDEMYSEARIDSSRSLVCDGFRVYEVNFRENAGVFLEEESIRGFQWLEGELVANSYGGVYRDGERLLDLEFNDGVVLEHEGWGYSMGQFVLRWPLSCPDELDLIHWPDSFMRDGFSYYDRRDGAVWNGRLWWYSYGRFGVYEENIWKVLTTEIDVFTAIPMDDALMLSTRGDGVWRFDGTHFESMGWPPWIEYNDVLEMGADRYLLATNHGLAIADQETGDFELRSIDEGIPSASVCAIVEDEWGTYWVSTFGGVIRYSLEHGVLEHHDPLVEFNRFSHAITPDGGIAFGSTRGIYTFRPTPPDLPKPEMPWDWLVGLLVLVIGSGVWVWRMELRKMKAQESASAERMESLERQALLAQIREGIYRDLQGASAESVADALEMSRRTLYRKCAECDIKLSALIREIRVEHARKLLDRGDLTFAAVASRVGYSPNHLRRVLNGED